MSGFENMNLQLLSHQLFSPKLSGCPLMALGFFAMLLDTTHSTMGTTNHSRGQEKAFTIPHRWLSLRRTHTQVNDILSQTYHCSSPYLASSGADLRHRSDCSHLLELWCGDSGARRVLHHSMHHVRSHPQGPHISKGAILQTLPSENLSYMALQ
jgi:hypothetical protein